MTTLAQLADRVGGRLWKGSRADAGSLVPVDVVHDSRAATPGALFCCVEGAHHDGHDHAPAAVRAGAVALLCRHRVEVGVPQVVVPDVRAAMAVAAAAVHGDPSGDLEVVGVTGTNGKTTVVAMMGAIASAAGRRAATIGTLTGERTTPESPDLQRQLAALRDDGVEVVAMEVSSHALVLHRVDSVRFAVGVFTNLGSDHLDFHGTQERYFAAKASLFEPGRCAVAVVNVDDVHGRLLRDAARVPVVPVSAGDAADVVTRDDGTEFTWRGARVHLPMHGRHNVMNALLAATAASELGVDPGGVAEGLAGMGGVPGRAEVHRAPNGGRVVVDYAHTPDALAAVLEAARGMAGGRGRVTVVFGCGGDRDRSKRPEMGRVACAAADRVVITTDNPRSEDPATIAAEVRAGCADAASPPASEPDRARAIRVALDGIGPHDVVVVAGKGHETGQRFADRTEPFDDREQVVAALAGLGPAAGPPGDDHDGPGEVER